MESFGKVKIISEEEEEILKAELLRMRAFNLLPETLDIDNSFYYMEMMNGSIIPYAMYIRGRMVAACYVSGAFDSLHIDQLFVMPELQGKGLRLGRSLLNYVVNDKERIEERLHHEFEYATIEPINKKVSELYQEEGYRHNGFMLSKKL